MDLPIALARALAAAMLMALSTVAVSQQVFPNKPIRFVVPYPPGGASNDLARFVGQKLSEGLGQPVIVDNRVGGNTVVASDVVAKSAPNGHTILYTAMAHVINPLLVPKLPFDPIKDFAPIAMLTQSRYVLTVSPSVPGNSLQEFIAHAKARPGQLNFVSSGTGSAAHLTGELFSMMTGLKMQHVPYKGAAQSLLDLAAGQVQVYLASALSVTPFVKAGRIKALAIVGDTRSSYLPQVPTFIEGGVPEFKEKNWFGVMAAAGTPRPIVDKLANEINKIISAPDTVALLAAQGGEPYIATPAEFVARLKSDMAMFAKVIKFANVKAE